MILALILALTSAPALGQDAGFDAHGFRLAPDDGDPLDFYGVWRPEVQTPASFAAGGLFEYAEAPLLLVREVDGTREHQTLLDNLFGLNLGLHAGLHERVGVALSMPVWFTSVGSAGPQGVGLGDARITAPIGLVLPELSAGAGGAFGLSVVPFVDLPVGANGKFLGAGGFGGGGLLSAGWTSGDLQLALNAGVGSNPAAAYQNLNGAAHLLFGLGAAYRVTDTVALRLEADLQPALVANSVPRTESPGELVLSARGRARSNGLTWTGGLGLPYTRGASAAAFRIFGGAGWVFGKSYVLDADHDGLADDVDACPNEPETINDYQDTDGCPDTLGGARYVVKDPFGKSAPGVQVLVGGVEVGRTDDAGVIVLSSAAPGTEIAVDFQTHKRTGFAPVQGEGLTYTEALVEREIQLEWLPGAVKVVTKSNQGAIVDGYVSFDGPVDRPGDPVGDDGEEVFVLEPGNWSLFVTAESFGMERHDLTIKPNQRSLVVIEVILKPAVVEVTKEEFVILEQIQFDFDKADITDESLPILREVANRLRTSGITSVEIQGHTDSEGPDAYNLNLSQRRMESVVDYLVGQGVDRGHITPVGYGEGCPLVDNDSNTNRAINRRVQFIILDPPPADGIPCHDGNPARRATERKVQPEGGP